MDGSMLVYVEGRQGVIGMGQVSCGADRCLVGKNQW